jgi:acetyltransferase
MDTSLEHLFARTRDPVIVRRARPLDSARLDQFYRRLSPLARRLRFHVGLKAVPPAWLTKYIGDDGNDALPLLATLVEDGHEVCIAEAGYASGGSGGGHEFALAVADDWQGRGLGACLLQRLIGQARLRGVAELHGDVLRDNPSMLALARRLGLSLAPHPDDPGLLRLRTCGRADSQACNEQQANALCFN